MLKLLGIVITTLERKFLMTKADPTDLTQLLSARRKQKEVSLPPSQVAPSTVVEQKKVGRPPGRRSDPNCSSLTLLVDEDTITDAKYKLRKLNRGLTPKKSLSDLVEELLQEWLSET
jgi:hypothetical protein